MNNFSSSNDLMVEILNGYNGLVYNFYHSYQGQVIRWILISYCLVVILDLTIYLLRYKNLLPYILYGGKRSLKRLGPEDKRRTMPMGPFEKIKIRLNNPDPDNWKLSVIEAEKMLDALTKQKDTFGKTIMERLSNLAEPALQEIMNELWQAHRVRNEVVHNPNFDLTNDEARKTVKAFEDAYQILEK
jgi:hypothetical protein